MTTYRYLFITCVTQDNPHPKPTEWAVLDRCIRSLIPDASIATCLGVYVGDKEVSYCVSTREADHIRLLECGRALAEMFGQECALIVNGGGLGTMVFPEEWGKYRAEYVGGMVRSKQQPDGDRTELCLVPGDHGLYKNYSTLGLKHITFER